MELIEVELIVDSLEDRENKKERLKGDKWYVTKERLDILLGNNAYHKCFVKETGETKVKVDKIVFDETAGSVLINKVELKEIKKRKKKSE